MINFQVCKLVYYNIHKMEQTIVILLRQIKVSAVKSTSVLLILFKENVMWHSSTFNLCRRNHSKEAKAGTHLHLTVDKCPQIPGVVCVPDV